MADALALLRAQQELQTEIGAQTVLAMQDIWPIMDADNLAGSYVKWQRAARPIIEKARNASGDLAAAYIQAFRASQLPAGQAPFDPVMDTLIPPDQLETSLLVTGPISVKRALSNGILIKQAMQIGNAMSAAAAMRHALDGGRNTVIATSNADPIELGWVRATSPGCCAFCAMLASRGAVYKSKESAAGSRQSTAEEEKGLFKVHDRCNCLPQPIYSPDAPLPEGTERFAALWQEAKRNATSSGDDVVTSFQHLIHAENE